MAIRALPVIEASFANPSLNKRKRGSSDAPASEPLGSELSVLYLLLYLFLLWGRHRDVTQAAQPARAAREPRGCTFAAEQRIKGVAERWAIRMLRGAERQYRRMLWKCKSRPRTTSDIPMDMTTLGKLPRSPCTTNDPGRVQTEEFGNHPRLQRGPNRQSFCPTFVAIEGYACRKSNPDILVVQPAENWAAKNLPGSFDGTGERRILLQR